MRLCQIVEAEVDPKTGEVHRWVDRDKLLRKYAGDKSVFVHFSDVNKLGLNPSSGFSTPIGIYSYPIDYVLTYGLGHDESEFRGQFSVPFAGDRNFAIVFRVKDLDKCWMIDGRTPFSFNVIRRLIRQWVRIIKTQITPIYPPHLVDGDPTDDENLFGLDNWHKWCEELVGPGLRWVGPEIELPGFPEADRLAEAIGLDNSQLNAVKFLTIVYNVIYNNWKVDSPDDLLFKLCRTIGKFVSKSPAVGWSKILMKLGYNGVIDNGNGIIHPSEPTQAVFFRLADLEHLETIRNKLDPNNIQRRDAYYGLGSYLDRSHRSVEAKRVRSGVIPDRIKSMLGFPLRQMHASTMHVWPMKAIIRECGEIAGELDEESTTLGDSSLSAINKFFHNKWSESLLKTAADQLHMYRDSLIIFKRNSPEKYSEIRPQLIENFKNYKEMFESYNIGRHEIMIPIVVAFDKLMRSV